MYWTHFTKALSLIAPRRLGVGGDQVGYPTNHVSVTGGRRSESRADATDSTNQERETTDLICIQSQFGTTTNQS